MPRLNNGRYICNKNSHLKLNLMKKNVKKTSSLVIVQEKKNIMFFDV